MVVIDFLDHSAVPERQVFSKPGKVITTACLSDVLCAMDEIQNAARGGSYCAGYVSYEASPAFDRAFKVKECIGFPLVWFGVFDRPAEKILPSPKPILDLPVWLPEVSKAEYDSSIGRIHEHIRAGNSYQVNYTFRLRTTLDVDTLDYYEHLRSVHPSPYSAYINTGQNTLISNSPELFLSFQDGKIKTKPMKGTARRGRWPEEDKLFAERLKTAEKERAEHVMIVDLMRSDLGKIANAGTTSAQDCFSLQRLPTVWQMTSIVKAEIDASISLQKIFRSTFPPGSVTGAPKAKTMEIIRDEECSPRKAYCGTIGYLKPGGSGTFSVPIRTVVVDNQTGVAECGVGGGITSGSVADDEYDEAIGKSRFLSAVSREFQLLESILLDDGVLYLLDYHLERLADAARYFQFDIDISDVRAKLHHFAVSCRIGKYKVRAIVGEQGDVKIAAQPIEELGTQEVALARSAIDVSSPFVFHKTTMREMYDEHKMANAGVYDVLLWNEGGFVTEFTSANVVVQLGGVRYTPPVSSGLLAGTFRRLLLETGQIFEREIRVSELANAEQVWLINSVRRWVPATVVRQAAPSG